MTTPQEIQARVSEGYKSMPKSRDLLSPVKAKKGGEMITKTGMRTVTIPRPGEENARVCIVDSDADVKIQYGKKNMVVPAGIEVRFRARRFLWWRWWSFDGR